MRRSLSLLRAADRCHPCVPICDLRHLSHSSNRSDQRSRRQHARTETGEGARVAIAGRSRFRMRYKMTQEKLFSLLKEEQVEYEFVSALPLAQITAPKDALE